jgi:transcriptional regulator with XRE-family HTH domain
MRNGPDPLGHLPTVAEQNFEAGRSATLLDRHLGKRVRLRREMLGADAKLIARMVGLDEPRMSRFERGELPFSAGLLYKFARILEVPIAWFYDGLSQSDLCVAPEPGDPLRAAERVVQELRRGERAATLATYFEGLDDHKKCVVIDVARALSAADVQGGAFSQT